MSDIIKNTLETIKSEHITPEPKWKSVLRRRSIWVFFGIAIFIGATTLAIASSIISDLDWDIPAASGRHMPLRYIFSSLPSFWIIILIIFITLALLGIRKTEHGYRYDFKILFALSLGSIFILGGLIWWVGLGNRFQSSLIHTFPFYGRHTITKETQWMQPHNGLLAGTIISVSETSFTLSDFTAKEWSITMDNDTIIRPAVALQKGSMVKIIGTQDSADRFTASEIKAWIGKGMRNGHGMMGEPRSQRNDF